ncbi:MAG: flagellar assembly protein FliW [Leptospirillum sp.]|jgi:flagellar assembly factor FliW|nr:flagellar assembly protein FliW [Nitrospiraceae bacterium]
MTIETTRFGTIPLDPERILTFPEGILGFPGLTRYLLLETGENSLFYWLQCVDDPSLAFVVMDPLELVPDYAARVLAALPDPGFQVADLSLMVVVTIPGDHMDQMTANLQGPLVVRPGDRTGKQFVLFEDDGWLRYPLFSAEQSSSAGTSGES